MAAVRASRSGFLAILGDQDQTGRATVPLVRLVKSALANAPPEIDVWDYGETTGRVREIAPPS